MVGRLCWKLHNIVVLSGTASEDCEAVRAIASSCMCGSATQIPPACEGSWQMGRVEKFLRGGRKGGIMRERADGFGSISVRLRVQS